MRDLAVGVSFLLGFEKELLWDVFEVEFFNFALEFNEVFDLLEEPDVNFGLFDDGFKGNTQFNGIVDVKQAIPARKFEGIEDFVLIGQFFAVGTETVAVDF